MGPPLTESPGQCRAYEQGRAGSLRRQSQPRAAENRVLKGWREQGGHRVPAKRSMVHGALQRAPSADRWSSHRDIHYEKTSGPPPQGRWPFRFKTGTSRAGNDCDAFCSAMERDQDGPRETVVDAKRVERSSRRRESVTLLGGLQVALARPGDCDKAHLFSRTGAPRDGRRA